MSRFANRRIELWVEARDGEPAVNPVMTTLLGALRSDGADVHVRVSEWEVTEPEDTTPPPDLVLLKTATTLGMSRAIADEARGVRFVNRADASLKTHDKAATVARLADAGLPVPLTFLTVAGAEALLAPPDVQGAWFVKPTRGVHGYGVLKHPGFPISSASAVPAAGATVIDDGTRLVQASVGNDAPDVKVYVAGASIFAGRKQFRSGSFLRDEIDDVVLDPATTDLVRSVGEALALTIFGVDLRLDEGVWFVIDANPFPGFRGFPDAVLPLHAEVTKALAT